MGRREWDAWLFNIYVRELGMKVLACKQCFKYIYGSE